MCGTSATGPAGIAGSLADWAQRAPSLVPRFW